MKILNSKFILRWRNVDLEKIEFGVYFVGAFIAKVMTALVFFYLARFLTAAQMGEIELYNTTLSVITPVASLQIWEACIRFLAKDTQDQQITSNIIGVIVIQVAVLITLELIFPQNHLFLTAIGVIITTFMAYYARAIDKIMYFKLPEILQKVTFALLIFFFVEPTVLGYTDANFISYFITALIITVSLFHYLKCNVHYINTKTMFKILSYTTPLVVNALGWWIITCVDRYVINFYYSEVEVGIYSIGIRVSQLLMLVLQNLYFVYQKRYITLFEKQQSVDRTTGRFYFLVVFGMVILYLLLPQSFIKFTLGNSSEFVEGVKYYYLFILSVLYWACAVFYGIGYLVTNQTRGASTTTFIAALINLVLNIILVKHFGIIGAVISTLIALFIWFFLRYHKQKDLLDYRFNIFEWGIFTFAHVLAFFQYLR